jgi:hypothetical protein
MRFIMPLFLVGWSFSAMTRTADCRDFTPAERDDILVRWEAASQRAKGLRGQFRRIVYDLTFEIERRTEGRFEWEPSGRFLYEVVPSDVRDGLRVSYPHHGVKSFHVTTAPGETWLFERAAVFRIDHKTGRVQTQLCPENRPFALPVFWTTISPDEFLPLLHQVTANEIRQRFVVQRFESALNYSALLKLRPQGIQLLGRYSEVQVMLSLKTFLPTAIKIIDPARTVETVHVFSNLTTIPDETEKR